MTKFIIEVVTDNPTARQKLHDELETRLLNGIDVDEGTQRFYDASILCYEDGIDIIPDGIVYSAELDGASNNEAMEPG